MAQNFVTIELKVKNINGFGGRVYVKLPNKWVIFIFLRKFCEETHCFLEKLTQLEKFYTIAGRDGLDKF